MKKCLCAVVFIVASGGARTEATASDASIEAIDNSQAGWRVKTDKVDLFITKSGAHMAPVRFYADTENPVEPYYISPWQNENLEGLPDPVLVPLRGDFFCMPFGANAEVADGEKHSGHGEASSSTWSFVSVAKRGGVTTLTLDLATKVRKGKITKKVHLLDGKNVVYSSHILEGYSGKMPIAHHCTLAVPEEEGELKIGVSKFELGMTCPVIFSNPINREYQSLAVSRRFTDLAKVPTLWKDAPVADCSSFPRRVGYTDLIQIFKRPSATPAWTTATCEKKGYLWFSLKNAAILPGTVFWISNKGRHGPPWNGRNRCLGLEESCSYFAEGLGPSIRPNAITEAGFPTAVTLSPREPFVVTFIQGVVKIPKEFDRVKEVKFDPRKVTFISATGKQVTADVDHEFLNTGRK